jgi:hypothetical protein
MSIDEDIDYDRIAELSAELHRPRHSLLALSLLFGVQY